MLNADTGETYSCDYYENAATGGGFTINKNLRIDATALNGINVVVDCSNIETSDTRVFSVVTDQDDFTHLIVDYLTFKNATSGVFYVAQDAELTLNATEFSQNGEIGGVIYTPGGTANVNGSAFEDNAGIVIALNGGTLNISESSFSDNNAGTYSRRFADRWQGAVIYAMDTLLTIDSTSFVNNKSATGGAIMYGGTTVNSPYAATVSNSVFSNNIATTNTGGAITAEYCQSLTVEDCVFNNNRAEVTGGAISCLGMSLNVSNSTFTENSAEQVGGVIFFVNDRDVGFTPKLSVTTSSFDENYLFAPSSVHGEAIACIHNFRDDGAGEIVAEIANTTFRGVGDSGTSDPDKSAFYFGHEGQTSSVGSYFTLENTLFTHNAVAVDTQGYSNVSRIVNSTFVDNATGLYSLDVIEVFNSIFWGNETSINAAYEVAGVESSLFDVAPIGNIQGSGIRIAAAGSSSPLNSDYTINENAAIVTLTDESTISVIDSGDNSQVDQNVDLAGNERIVGDAVDLGAYEVQTSSNALIDEAFADFFDEFFE